MAGYLLVRRRREERGPLGSCELSGSVEFDSGRQAVDIVQAGGGTGLEQRGGEGGKREVSSLLYPWAWQNHHLFSFKGQGLVSFHSCEETVVECVRGFCWFGSHLGFLHVLLSLCLYETFLNTCRLRLEHASHLASLCK